MLFRRRARDELVGAEQKIGARVRKSRQKEAAGAADAGLMQIEWSKGEVLKLTAVGTETEEEVDERVGWQSIVEHDVRKDAQWGSDQEQGGRGRARGTVRRFRVVGEAFHSAVVTNSGGERSWI